MFAAFNWFLHVDESIQSEWIGEYSIQYDKVRLKQEFGPFQKDEVIQYLCFNFETAECIEYDVNGKVLRSCKFGIAAFDGAAEIPNEIDIIATDAIAEGIQEGLQDRLSTALDLLRRIRGWDQLPETGDGPYWISEIDKVISAPVKVQSYSGAPMEYVGQGIQQRAASLLRGDDSFTGNLDMDTEIESLTDDMAEFEQEDQEIHDEIMSEAAQYHADQIENKDNQ